MLKFEFEDAEFEGSWSGAFRDLELGMIADFSLRVGDKVVYREDGFTVFELRLALGEWSRRALTGTAAFEFVSVESDEPGLLWFRLQPSGRYRVGSIHQEEIAFVDFSASEIHLAARGFIDAVDDWVLRHLDLVVADYLGAP